MVSEPAELYRTMVGELVEPTDDEHREFANKACPCFEVKEEL